MYWVPVYGTYKIIATCVECTTMLSAQNNTCVMHVSLKQGQSALCYSLLILIAWFLPEGKAATKLQTLTAFYCTVVVLNCGGIELLYITVHSIPQCFTSRSRIRAHKPCMAKKGLPSAKGLYWPKQLLQQQLVDYRGTKQVAKCSASWMKVTHSCKHTSASMKNIPRLLYALLVW